MKGMPPRDADRRSRELLCAFNLTEMAGRKIGTYSGGMKQRLLLAQAMLDDPMILVLDEPTAGLDPKERIRFRNILGEMGKNKIVIVATHVVSDIECIAKEILLI